MLSAVCHLVYSYCIHLIADYSKFLIYNCYIYIQFLELRLRTVDVLLSAILLIAILLIAILLIAILLSATYIVDREASLMHESPQVI